MQSSPCFNFRGLPLHTVETPTGNGQVQNVLAYPDVPTPPEARAHIPTAFSLQSGLAPNIASSRAREGSRLSLQNHMEELQEEAYLAMGRQKGTFLKAENHFRPLAILQSHTQPRPSSQLWCCCDHQGLLSPRLLNQAQQTSMHQALKIRSL